MSDTTDLAAWMEKSMAVVADDVGRARTLLADAVGQLVTSVESLRGQLAAGRQPAEVGPRMQADLDTAIRALQFEDMLTQLLDGVRGKLDALGGVFVQILEGQEGAALRATLAATEPQIQRNAVTQRDVASGDIELF